MKEHTEHQPTPEDLQPKVTYPHTEADAEASLEALSAEAAGQWEDFAQPGHEAQTSEIANELAEHASLIRIEQTAAERSGDYSYWSDRNSSKRESDSRFLKAVSQGLHKRKEKEGKAA